MPYPLAFLRARVVLPIVAAAFSLGGVSAVCAQTDPVAVAEVAAADSCLSFALRVEVYGSRSVYKEFFDKNGNVVRVFSGGKGYTLKFFNLASGASLTLRPNGSNDFTTFNADGTYNVVTTGHYVLIYFSTDMANGGVPFARQFVGRVVQNINPSTGVYTLLRANGTMTDICAVLSG